MINHNIIEVKNVSKVFRIYGDRLDRLKEVFDITGKRHSKDFFALKNINISVQKGETVALIGRNGAGKSTLLKILAGVLTPTEGTVNVTGRVTSLLELGVGFNPEYTGIENIYQYGMFYQISKSDLSKKIDSIIKFADIGDFVDRPVKTYSSGMFARLAFSVIIHLDPEILIVDEALAVGDVFFQQKCNLYMKNEMANVTKLLVTHDLNSVVSLADRAIYLENGEVKFIGDPIDAVEMYMKSLQNDLYSNGEIGIKKSKIDPKELAKKDFKSSKKENRLTSVDLEKCSGAFEVVIESYGIFQNDKEFKGIAKVNDLVQIKMIIRSERDMDELIIGYLINDKFGKTIFGDNTFSSGFRIKKVEKENLYLIHFEFIWPEIKEDEYFLTIGIGEGVHEMHHKIQCWAHNIVKITNITPESTLHALFNNRITDFEIETI